MLDTVQEMKPLDTVSLLADERQSPKSRTSFWGYICVLLSIISLSAAIVVSVFVVNTDSDSASDPAPSLGSNAESTSTVPPNVIMIMMDDLGFTDAGYYSNYRSGNDYSFSTPNIERFASEGIKLHQHYSEHICSTTRSSLLSGRYPWKTGLDYVVQPGSTHHTDTALSLLPEVLRDEYNYKTLMIGKWHIGYAAESMVPFNRGFDEAIWFTLGGLAYYDHTVCTSWSSFDQGVGNSLDPDIVAQRNEVFGSALCSYDLHDENYEPVQSDEYLERIFTDKLLDYINDAQYDDDPFFVYYSMPTPHVSLTMPPISFDAQCGHIADERRAILCHMMQYADSMMGEIDSALRETGLMENTMVVFLSDNGGATSGARGQNLPLRGQKTSKFEGGVRTPSFVYGGYVDRFIGENAQCDYEGLFHVSDWLPTLLQAASGNTLHNEEVDAVVGDAIGVDGFALWSDMLSQCGYESENDSQREQIISARVCGDGDDAYFFSTYIRQSDWKLIVNNSAGCAGAPTVSGDIYSYYPFFDGSAERKPVQEVYTQYMATPQIDSERFRSVCYEAMADRQKRNEANFAIRDLMLFNVSGDAIEACDLSQQYPEVVASMLAVLDAEVKGHYRGSSTLSPAASAVLRDVESYDCEHDQSYLLSWQDAECCGDESFDDWNFVWQTAIDNKLSCQSQIENA